MIKDFLEETKSLFKYLPDYVIYEHRKYHTNGKVGVDYPTALAPDFPPLRKIIFKEYDDPQKVFEKKGTEMIAGIELTERKNKIED